MILPTYRPMFHDELLYGWINDLAKMNYHDDCYGLQRTAKMLFPYGYAPGQRHLVKKGEIVKKDYQRGLSASLRRLSDHGYRVPDIERIISFNTIESVMGICRKPVTQARYLCTALSSVYGDLFDLPLPPPSIKDLYLCPKCMQEKQYLRTWHQLPGVTACCIHKILLQPVNGVDCNQNIIYADEGVVRFAALAKEIYDNPCPISVDTVKTLLLGRASPSEINTLNRSLPFTKVIETLIKYCVPYTDLISSVSEQAVSEQVSDGVRIFKVLSTRMHGQIVEVMCPDCGRAFETVPHALKSGFGCPDCIRKANPEKIIAHSLERIGDGNYVLVGNFRGLSAEHKIIHATCGTRFRGPIMRKVWDGKTCKCEMAHTIDSVQKRIDRVTKGFTVLSYRPRVESMILRHEVCGETGKYYLQQFIKTPKCSICRETGQHDAAVSKIMTVLGEGYSYVNTENSGKENYYTIRHNICGTETSGTVRQYIGTKYIRPKRCPLCYKYEEGTRILNLSTAGIVLDEMTDWFKMHKTWVLSQHREYSGTKYYNAIANLKKRGIIYHVSFGVYAKSAEVTVYDILEEKYLMDSAGTRTGRYTGETAEYMAGKREFEPDVITLESSLIKNTDRCTRIVCGRTVIIKGC